MKSAGIIAVLICMLGLAGCQAFAPSQATIIRQWTAQQGGTLNDQRLGRITSIGETLTRQAGCGKVQFFVLNQNSVVAYSWPSGEIFLSARLIDQSSDDEIAAAIAHELGHLLSDGHIHTTLALRGTKANVDMEERADRIGCQLLAATGRSTQSLASVLMKVCAASPTAECRNDIRRRIALIDARENSCPSFSY